MAPNVVCVLKKSSEYDFDYVEHLRDGVQEFLPDASFSCIVESEWPGWWCKMEIFRPEITGDLLYFDLDTLIVGDLSDIASVGCLTMLSDFNLPHYVASGVMYLPEQDRRLVWDEWIKDPESHMRKHRGHGDGGFLSQFYKAKAARWQDLLPEQIVSYKVHVRKGLMTRAARVVCFHGQPRPRTVDWKI